MKNRYVAWTSDPKGICYNLEMTKLLLNYGASEEACFKIDKKKVRSIRGTRKKDSLLIYLLDSDPIIRYIAEKKFKEIENKGK